MAAAMGVWLGRKVAVGDASQNVAVGDASHNVAIAGDGRPITAELLAAVAEGLRWAGCDVVEIGPASAACLAFAVDHSGAGGGILVGNPGRQPQVVGLKFWAPGPRPLSAVSPTDRQDAYPTDRQDAYPTDRQDAYQTDRQDAYPTGGTLEPLKEIYQAGVDRPTRRSGSLRRFRARVPYLAKLAGYYHALRPLRLVLDSSCEPLSGYLEKLTEPVACRIIRRRRTRDGLSEQVCTDQAHFAAGIDDDGERCRVLDEQGRQVPAEQLLLLIARHLLAERPQGAVVLEEGTSPSVAAAIDRLGGGVVFTDARRSEMAAAIDRQEAVFGGGPSGRFWYTTAGLPLPDAVMTLTLLLVLLSRSDRPFSEVLDREARLR